MDRLTVARVRGVPIELHWTLPLGVFLWGGFKFAPVLWGAAVALILLHETGHAVVVRACRLRVAGIMIHGAGGHCRWEGKPTDIQRGLIAWGGVWAQSVLLVVALMTRHQWFPLWSNDLRQAFIDMNCILIGLNLLPVRPLDGAEAWSLFAAIWRRRHENRINGHLAPETKKMLLDVLNRARRGRK